MLIDLLQDSFIQVGIDVTNPNDVIEQSSSALLEANKIDSSYITAMKNSLKENGPYFLIAPHFALLHARPEDGVNETCLSLATLKNPVSFNHQHNDPVKVAMVLGSTDKSQHIDAMRELMSVLMKPNSIETIYEKQSSQDIILYMKQALSKKKLRILAVCGMGLGSSLMLSMSVESILKKLNIEGEVEITDLGNAKSMDVDVIVTSPEIAEQLQDHSANVIPIINMLDENEIEQKLSNL